MPSAEPTKPASERTIVLLVGAIQFVNILDFMMVMPLGPDFAEALGISTSHIGILGGSYTAAAAVAGVFGSLFLDRFDRRVALGYAMLGLVIGTALGGVATGLGTLLGARILAGAFGGPATSLALAIVTDAVPPERRGRALGAVMTSFSLASILGVPAGLELARLWTWRAPFFAVALLGLILAGASVFMLPPLRTHLSSAAPVARLPKFDKAVLLSLTNTSLVMLGVFAVVPNISAFVQHNMGYPRAKLGLLYLVGGIASFAAMRVVGNLVDRFGAGRLVTLGTLLHLVALVFAFIAPVAAIPVLAIFTVYMLSGSVRMVPLQTLATQVPAPTERARFMSSQSVVQHVSSAIGAIAASAVLIAEPDGTLLHMNYVAMAAFGLASLVPLIAFSLEKILRQRSSPSQIAITPTNKVV